MSAEPVHVEVDDRYASIPEALLYDPAISADAVRVYGALRRHGSDPANCYPSHRRIADLIGKSARSVPAWIRQLEEAGWIERVPRWVRAGDVTSDRPDHLGDGWEPTSNGYRVYGRAGERGVRAGEQGGSALGSGDPSALGSAPKESKSEREPLNEEPLFAASAAQGAPESAEEQLAPEHGFSIFWDAYPRRNGKREGRSKALVQWAKLSLAERRAAFAGAQIYASDVARGLTIAADAFRWLRDRRWEEWQEHMTPDRQRAGARNGRPPRDGMLGLADVADQLDEHGMLPRQEGIL